MEEFKQLAAKNINSAAVMPMRRIDPHEHKASRDYSFILSDAAENPTLPVATSVNKNMKSCLRKGLIGTSKMKPASLHKGLIGSKASLSKKQVGRGKEFRRIKQILLPPQPQGTSLPKHQEKGKTCPEPWKAEVKSAKKPIVEEKIEYIETNKMKFASLRKGLIGSKAPLSKKQVGRGKEFRRLKEILLPLQPQGKSLPEHQIKKRPMQEPIYEDDEVD